MIFKHISLIHTVKRLNSFISNNIVSKVGEHSRGWPEGSLFDSYYTKCKGGRYSFPWIASLYLDPYLIMLSVKLGGIKFHFSSPWYDATWDWTQVSRNIGAHLALFICLYLVWMLNRCIWCSHVLPLWTRVDLGVMAMKWCSALSKAPALLEPRHQIV